MSASNVDANVSLSVSQTVKEAKSKRHYHVMNGIAGSIPDNDEVYKTKQEAKWGLKLIVDHLRQSGEEYEGNLKTGVFKATEGFYYACISNPCYQSECLSRIEEEGSE